MQTLTVHSRSRTAFINISEQVQEAIARAGLEQGVVTVFVPHTTAGITINENADPDVVADMTGILDELIPWNNNYRHMEGNSAAHMKASMMGNSTQILVENGRLMLGTWQGIYFCEFDGPRNRKVWVSH